MDVRHDDSVRGRMEAMEVGETITYPIRKLLYIRNQTSTLNCVHYKVHRWRSKQNRVKGVMEITKLY